MVLTPSSISGIAGDIVSIDYTSGSAVGMKDIKIEAAFNGNASIVLKDTFFTSKPKVEDLNFNYTIPDSAAAGQKSVLTFTVTDTAGKTTSKQATVNVTSSRPRITVSQNNTTGHAGDSVIFTITMKSTEANIDSLSISQSINSSVFTKIAGFAYSNLSLVNTTYKYQIPNSSAVGDKIALFFTVTNNSKITNYTSKNITVN